jgi:hypothetical protein
MANANIDILDRMAKYQPGHGQYNFYADTRWKGPVTPAHKIMKYDPKSLYDWRGPQVIPMHYDPKSSDDWNPHIDSDYSFFDRFPDGVESDADNSASEGGKKRKNTIKRRKRRNGRKSRRKVGKSRRNGRSKH